MRTILRGRLKKMLYTIVLAVMIVIPAVAGQMYIVGNATDQQSARDAGLAGTYVGNYDDVPAGADAVILGRSDAPGGTGDDEYEALLGDGCRLMRFGAENRSDVKRAAASLKKMIDDGRDPFADVTRTMGQIEAPKGYPILEQTELNKSGKTSLNPLFQPQNLFPRPVSISGILSAKAAAIASKLDTVGRVALDVRFGVESADISARSIPILNRVLELLRARPSMKLIIEGHTDNYKSSEFNQLLSEQRAHKIRSWFIDRGISSANLQAVGYGETRPVAPNITSAGRAKNRRVELVKAN